jgi:hypothetical protein
MGPPRADRSKRLSADIRKDKGFKLACALRALGGRPAVVSCRRGPLATRAAWICRSERCRANVQAANRCLRGLSGGGECEEGHPARNARHRIGSESRPLAATHSYGRLLNANRLRLSAHKKRSASIPAHFPVRRVWGAKSPNDQRSGRAPGRRQPPVTTRRHRRSAPGNA